MRPHRWQPMRLPHPSDSPGKNTGVGCHFLLQCMKGKSESEVAQLCPTLLDPMVCSLPGSSIHGIFQARVLEWVAIAFLKGNAALNCYNLPNRVAMGCMTVMPLGPPDTTCTIYTLYVHYTCIYFIMSHSDFHFCDFPPLSPSALSMR